MGSQYDAIQPPYGGPPVPVPVGYTGPVALPGTGRTVWWTGRVAIGLRHEQPVRRELGLSAEQIQTVLLRVGRAGLTFAELAKGLRRD